MNDEDFKKLMEENEKLKASIDKLAREKKELQEDITNLQIKKVVEEKPRWEDIVYDN